MTHYRSLSVAVAGVAVRLGSYFPMGRAMRRFKRLREVTFRSSCNSSKSVQRLQYKLNLLPHYWMHEPVLHSFIN